MAHLFSLTSLLALASLLLLQFLTSFDNISFLTTATSKLTAKKQQGLVIGVLFSIILSFILLWAITQFTFFNNVLFNLGNINVTPHFLLLFLGGISIVLNSIKLIYNLLLGKSNFIHAFSPKETILAVILQIALINFAFSLDSILVSIGLVGNLSNAFYLIATSIIIYALLMTFLADNLSLFLENNKKLRVLGYIIVALLGFSLVLQSLGIASIALF